MEHQRKLEDRKTALDLLSNESLVRINAKKTEARAELLNRLSGFWDEIGMEFNALLMHDASELILVFQMYAQQQYDAYAQEFVAGIGGHSPQWSTDVIDRLSNEIRPPRRPSPKGDLAPSLWAQLEPYVPLIKNGLLYVEDDGCLPCDWEICLTKSFRGLECSKPVKRSQMCEILFRLRYRDYLRWYPAWMEFDRRLRLHLSGRYVSGPTRPQTLTPSDAVPAVNSMSVEVPLSARSQAHSTVQLSENGPSEAGSAKKAVVRNSNSNATHEAAEETLLENAESSGPETASEIKKPIRTRQASPKYRKIDVVLKQIAAAQPADHKEVFAQLKSRKVPIPDAEPFRSAHGWKEGFDKNPSEARSWLSKRWTGLHLPGFPRGPKK